MRRLIITVASSIMIVFLALGAMNQAAESGAQVRARTTTTSSTTTHTSTTTGATRVESATLAKTTSTSTASVAETTQSTDTPVYLEDFPDPFVLTTSTGYLAYSTNSRGSNVPVITSTDLVHWYSLGDALPQLPSWAASSGTWAPSVIDISGTYVMYVTVHDTRRDLECIVTATSTRAAGPYVVSSDQPLVCAPKGSIDASVLRDNDGQLWLTWKNEPYEGHPAEIVSARLSSDGMSVTGTPTSLIGATEAWENHNVEGPSLVETAHGYILFFSTGSWRSSGYSTGYATCATPTGPCTVSNGKWLSSADQLDGPGGLQVFRSSNGTTYAAFHTWQPCTDCAQWRRELNIRRVDLTTAVPTLD